VPTPVRISGVARVRLSRRVRREPTDPTKSASKPCTMSAPAMRKRTAVTRIEANPASAKVRGQNQRLAPVRRTMRRRLRRWPVGLLAGQVVASHAGGSFRVGMEQSGRAPCGRPNENDYYKRRNGRALTHPYSFQLFTFQPIFERFLLPKSSDTRDSCALTHPHDEPDQRTITGDTWRILIAFTRIPPASQTGATGSFLPNT